MLEKYQHIVALLTEAADTGGAITGDANAAAANIDKAIHSLAEMVRLDGIHSQELIAEEGERHRALATHIAGVIDSLKISHNYIVPKLEEPPTEPEQQAPKPTLQLAAE